MTGHKPEKKEVSAKSETALREEATLKFWQENKIFEKSLEQTAGKPEFVFYDGPPFATGLPHTGTLLASVAKDALPRYKTMRGYYVRRRWGWDTHGLPIENMIEKDLGLKSKKDILEMGIEKFNEACRAKVMQYAHDWQKYVDRIGRWVEFENAYKTMDATYTESVWWALKQLSDKGLLYEGRKVLMYCPHCETPLAKAEIAQDNSYKDVTEEAVTVKFKVKNPEILNLPQDTYLLAWTTTPWTLPANVALAVNYDLRYGLYERSDSHYILEVGRAKEYGFAEPKETFRGCDFYDSLENKESLKYEPLFHIPALEAAKSKTVHTVLQAPFVTAADGTGIVHTAVLYGEDDYQLGLKNDLPMVPLLNPNGTYNNDVPEFLRGQHIKKADKIVIEDLEKRGLLFAKALNTHSYPHCYRCGTPLIYNALSSWFINIQKIKARMIELNEKVNWVPGHLKHGRFLHIVENAPDWTISRNRFWASPLPIWKHGPNSPAGEGGCDKIAVIGSREELKSRSTGSGNRYFFMRHGQSVSNAGNYISSVDSPDNVLTDKGREQVKATAEKLKGEKIDLIFASDFTRTKMTAELVGQVLGVSVVTDERIREVNTGMFNHKSPEEYHAYFSSLEEKFTKTPEGGENLTELKDRAMRFLEEIEAKYKDKNILIVTHEYTAWMLYAGTQGLTPAEAAKEKERRGEDFLKNAEAQKLEYVPLPHNARHELDYHRPYIDAIKLTCECGGVMTRIPEVIDCWVESGSMPFAEYHYPFENKGEFEKRTPGDYVAEYVGQTRTWFYYMHAIATALFDHESFKNVVVTGNILAGDGKNKMSKSKNNYTDPLLLMDRFGANALRFVLLASPVMQAEDVAFRDDDVKEVSQRLVNILWNVVQFYVLHVPASASEVGPLESEPKVRPQDPDSAHVLDRWILARLTQLHAEVTTNLDAYNTPAATRPLREFVTDLSTWYLRRSRGRFKSDDMADKQAAIATTRYVLLELAKILAPVMPFLAEDVYKAVGGKLESVHLEKWSEMKVEKAHSEVLENTRITREVVTLALEARQKADIKVRQPLSKLAIKTALPAEYLALIKDEVNVKEVVVDEKLGEGEVSLDVTLTPELELEGKMRDLVREIQDARSDKMFKPSELIRVTVPKKFKEVVERYGEEIKKKVSAREVLLENIDGVEVENI